MGGGRRRRLHRPDRRGGGVDGRGRGGPAPTQPGQGRRDDLRCAARGRARAGGAGALRRRRPRGVGGPPRTARRPGPVGGGRHDDRGAARPAAARRGSRPGGADRAGGDPEADGVDADPAVVRSALPEPGRARRGHAARPRLGGRGRAHRRRAACRGTGARGPVRAAPPGHRPRPGLPGAPCPPARRRHAGPGGAVAHGGACSGARLRVCRSAPGAFAGLRGEGPGGGLRLRRAGSSGLDGPRHRACRVRRGRGRSRRSR